MQSPTPTAQPPAFPERRIDPAQHALYTEARELLHPLLANPDHHNGATFYKAIQKLQQRFPDLNGHEIEALLAAVLRHFQPRSSGR